MRAERQPQADLDAPVIVMLTALPSSAPSRMAWLRPPDGLVEPCQQGGVNRLGSGAAVIAAGESYLRLGATSTRRPCFPRTTSGSEYE
jgi:hypothetical protein